MKPLLEPHYSFIRYLRAKKSVDDRSLNGHVFGKFRQSLLDRANREPPPRILEIGSGIGTMVERLMDWNALPGGSYTGIDLEEPNVRFAYRELRRWAKKTGRALRVEDCQLIFPHGASGPLSVAFENRDLYDLLEDPGEREKYDVLIAHAFLDLVPLDRVVPRMLKLLRPGGMFYFTLNFDGHTILEPPLDAGLDARIVELYHRSMDAGGRSGRPPGDSRTGRRLFSVFRRLGVPVGAAGSSDWTVFATDGAYPEDEAYFLHHFVHFIDDELTGHPELDSAAFRRWLEERHAQIHRGELVLIVHQMDFWGQVK